MSFIIKFIFFSVIFYFIFRFFGNVIKVFRNLSQGRPNSQYRPQQSREPEPETQEDRIISYHKKSFETSYAEDADFVEIKEDSTTDNR